MMSGMMTKAQVKNRIALLKSVGLTVEVNFGIGIVKAIDADGKVAFRAIAKGKGQPWIVRHANTDLCRWA